MGGQVSTADVHVVVVGGGFGGIAAALQLQSRGLAFTLIDLRDSFHHNVAALRASLQPGNIMTLDIPNWLYLPCFYETSLVLFFYHLHFKRVLYCIYRFALYIYKGF